MEEYVLITGATSGIGYELAKVFARNGYNLIIASRDRLRMENVKGELEKTYRIEVQIITVDLSQKGGALLLYNEVRKRGLVVNILINNAGSGYVGDFNYIDYEKDESLLTLNINSLTELTKYFSRDMLSKRSGKIVNVASTGAYHPGAYTATYYASKAYVLAFTEAVSIEMKPYNVEVMALCPGATKTNFSKSAGKKESPFVMEASVVAKLAYKGIMHNEKVIVPGIRNKLFIKLPRRIGTYFVAKYQKKLIKK